MASRHLSLRISEGTYARLEAQGRRSRESVSELARRLIEEGLRMEAHAGIVFRSGPAGRRAALADGPDVWVVARVLRDMSCPFDEAVLTTAQLTELRPSQVSIAAHYYSEHREEIDEWLRRLDEEAEQAYSAWLRDQPLLQR